MSQELQYDLNAVGGGGMGGFGYGNNPLLWLITLGFLKGGDVFGGNSDANTRPKRTRKPRTKRGNGASAK